LKTKKKSLHKLPKQQSTSFWSQGILGANKSQGWISAPKPIKFALQSAAFGP
jgi:hypothetical protein